MSNIEYYLLYINLYYTSKKYEGLSQKIIVLSEIFRSTQISSIFIPISFIKIFKIPLYLDDLVLIKYIKVLKVIFGINELCCITN